MSQRRLPCLGWPGSIPARRPSTAAAARSLQDICTVVKRREHELGEVDVVEPHYRDVFRHAMRGAVERMQRADGGHIVGAHYGRGQLRQSDQTLHRRDAALHGVAALDQMIGRRLQPQLGHRSRKRVATRHGRALRQRPADECDLAMAQRGQMLHSWRMPCA